MKLFEGLKEGDLEDLVVPLISIDEYESKLDDDAIVFAFFVMDKNPAQDLNRFIQKGAYPLLDTDVSPAPNEDGYFMVFIEVLRDENFSSTLLSTLSDIKGLTRIEEWNGQFYGQEETLPINEETLSQYVRLDPLPEVEEDEEVEDISEALTEFFRQSDLESLSISGDHITLEGIQSSVGLEFVDLGPFESMRKAHWELSQGLRLDEAAQSNVSRLQRILGDLWVVEHLENHVLLSNILGEEVALLRI